MNENLTKAREYLIAVLRWVNMTAVGFVRSGAAKAATATECGFSPVKMSFIKTSPASP